MFGTYPFVHFYIFIMLRIERRLFFFRDFTLASHGGECWLDRKREVSTHIHSNFIVFAHACGVAERQTIVFGSIIHLTERFMCVSVCVYLSWVFVCVSAGGYMCVHQWECQIVITWWRTLKIMIMWLFLDNARAAMVVWSFFFPVVRQHALLLF